MTTDNSTSTLRTLLNTEESRKGAMACLSAIQKIGGIDIGISTPRTPDEHWRLQDSAIMAMISAAKAQPDFMAGFLGVLGEYVSMIENDGPPNLYVWIPEATMTPAEVESNRARVLEDIEYIAHV